MSGVKVVVEGYGGKRYVLTDKAAAHVLLNGPQAIGSQGWLEVTTDVEGETTYVCAANMEVVTLRQDESSSSAPVRALPESANP